MVLQVHCSTDKGQPSQCTPLPGRMWWKGCPHPCVILLLLLSLPASIRGTSAGLVQTPWLQTPQASFLPLMRKLPALPRVVQALLPLPTKPSSDPKSTLLVCTLQTSRGAAGCSPHHCCSWEGEPLLNLPSHPALPNLQLLS